MWVNQAPGPRFWPLVTFEESFILKSQQHVWKTKLLGHLKAAKTFQKWHFVFMFLLENLTDCYILSPFLRLILQFWNLDLLNWLLNLLLFYLLRCSNWFWSQYLFSIFFLSSVSSGTSFLHLWLSEPQSRCFLHWQCHLLLPSSFVSHRGLSCLWE